jgi:deoxycytidylate deaminase
MNSEGLVVGLTGSFGSGCHEASKYLKSEAFDEFSLSGLIKEEAQRRGIDRPSRRDMQNIGDDLRRENGNAFLANKVITEIGDLVGRKIVVKSIRNHHEVKALRDVFHERLLLLNIDAEKDTRFSRCKENYTSRADFDYEDERDSGESQPEYGQHVRRCVDLADVVINNGASIPELQKKVQKYVSFILSPGSGAPDPCETNMRMAFEQSRQSLCRKRGIGAVIARDTDIIAGGFNGPPIGVAACTSLTYCYKDHSKECDACGTPFQAILRVCIKCRRPIEQERTAELEKNLDLCRGVHGEERAILRVIKNGRGSVVGAQLYTTTFPCLLCAKKIIEVGISDVWYVEPYPFTEAYRILREAGVKLHKFEGVKSTQAMELVYPRRT